ncbi:leucyl/phenylalanyl-tRNA--protein transferase [Fimbriimonas ginsengisoli]|uniref:Leucyl/phenylalanyl-tRNA--protein transferase n=1 Tax=Fimbriimonas ginsengisoli Gsoil 348 TaxID=661478 RepID=A0A068NYQ1_FIMGI|nr:leucyl/phenylalanyl-tRNA--protein transferase [Fimbriimonas ginsengisoli]AIE87214.1 leucyl/phenylalanyl-tRNA--protein transferase [Fimbriimonas ginsengisoli Gsoil 348]
MRGNELTPWLVRYGYERACFPMTMDDGEVEWFQPRDRCLFPIEGVHVSRSLARTIRRGVFEVRFDTDFEAVIRGCFRPDDNWLSEDFVRVYSEIHRQGWGHCAECWQDGRLVGGVYGIALGSCFSAESMFHRETDASKVALWAMVDRCRELGFTIFDAQIMNPHLASLGAFEVPHRRYERLLRDALKQTTPWSIT